MYNINAVEVWLSLVEYYVRDVGAAGSNPVTSTNTPLWWNWQTQGT